LKYAPAVFTEPGDCICNCDVPKCYDGEISSAVNAIPVEEDGLKPGKECKMSLYGRAKLERCCTYKIETFKKLIAKTQNCVNDPADLNISTWCDGVPDGEAVQIGGRSSASPKYWNHQSPNACVAASWNQVDYTDIEGKDQLFETAAPTIAPTPAPTLNFTFMPTPMTTAPTPAPTKQCLDDDVGIKKDQGMSNCSEVAEFCADLTYGPMVQKYCPKTCGKCTEIDEALEDMMNPGGPHQVDVELDDALAGAHELAGTDRSRGWTLTPMMPFTHTPTQDQGCFVDPDSFDCLCHDKMQALCESEDFRKELRLHSGSRTSSQTQCQHFFVCTHSYTCQKYKNLHCKSELHLLKKLQAKGRRIATC